MNKAEKEINDLLKIGTPALYELKDYVFIIPYYQRGYRWSEENVKILLEDLKEFIENKDEQHKNYYLQPLAISKEASDNKEYNVVDGQQRLTTLYLIYKYLNKGVCGKDLYTFKNNNNENINLLKNENLKLLTEENEKDCKTIDEYYIRKAYTVINKWFNQADNEANNLKENFVKLFTDNSYDKKIRFLIYPVNSTDGHEVFQNINSGKIQLTNSELLKAILLNKSSGLNNKEQIAYQFEKMERTFADDKFWYMFNRKDVVYEKGQSRLDILFNIVSDVKPEDYNNDARCSFYVLSKDIKGNELFNVWNKVRKYFQILLDFFKNPEIYHYIGFLNYAHPYRTYTKSNEAHTNSFSLVNYLEKYQEKTKSDFLAYLKKEIELYFKKDSAYFKDRKFKDITYDNNSKELSKLFVLHNIQTILNKYKNLHKENKVNLQYPYENFPFDLLNTQTWNIEHIDSQTPIELEEEEQIDWIKEILNEFQDFKFVEDEGSNNNPITFKDIDRIENILKDPKLLEKFSIAYNEYLFASQTNDNKVETHSLGNLVLLDMHTNTSYHNSPFPKKRRTVLQSNGLFLGEYNNPEVKYRYIPICTRQVFNKAYSGENDTKFRTWTKQDAEHYLEDIKSKLAEFKIGE